MSDVVADVLAEWGVVPENAVSLSVFAFGCRGGFVTEGVLISASKTTNRTSPTNQPAD